MAKATARANESAARAISAVLSRMASATSRSVMLFSRLVATAPGETTVVKML